MSKMSENHERWMREAKKKGATHFIDVCDTFDYTNYPVYVMPGQDVSKIEAKYDGVNMQSVDAVVEVK